MADSKVKGSAIRYHMVSRRFATLQNLLSHHVVAIHANRPRSLHHARNRARRRCNRRRHGRAALRGVEEPPLANHLGCRAGTARVIAVGAASGAALGAVLAPLTSWVFLRRVPLGAALLQTAVGTTVGAAIGLGVDGFGLRPGSRFPPVWLARSWVFSPPRRGFDSPREPQRARRVCNLHGPARSPSDPPRQTRRCIDRVTGESVGGLGHDMILRLFNTPPRSPVVIDPVIPSEPMTSTSIPSPTSPCTSPNAGCWTSDSPHCSSAGTTRRASRTCSSRRAFRRDRSTTTS